MRTGTENAPTNRRNLASSSVRLLLLVVVCLLVASPTGSAQQKKLAKFTTLAPGFEVLRLWEIVEGF